MTPIETSRAPATRRHAGAIAAIVVGLGLLHGGEARSTPADPTCHLRWSLQLERPPAIPLFRDAPALATTALDPVAARLRGLDARIELAPGAHGLDLNLHLAGPVSRRAQLLATLDAAGRRIVSEWPTARPAPSDASTPNTPTDTPTDSAIDAAWAAFHAIHPPLASDRDPDIAEPRLRLVVQAAAPTLTTTCNTPPGPAPISLTAASPLVVGPRPRAPSTTPPRLHLIVPAIISADESRLLSVLVSHGGSAIHRSLTDPPVRANHVQLHTFRTGAFIVLSLDLPPATDWRTHLHEATRTLTRPTFAAADVRGAARLAGLDPDRATTLARRLATLLDPQGGVWVHVTPPTPPPAPPPPLDAAARDLFAAVSVDLRCPAPSETRPPDERIAARFGLDAAAWRALAREVAAAPDVAAWLERDIIDRCEELKRLRRLVTPTRFSSIYQGHACTIRPETDPDRRWRAERALMQRHQLDSSLLRPILGMAAGDPALERIVMAIDKRCPPPGTSR